VFVDLCPTNILNVVQLGYSASVMKVMMTVWISRFLNCNSTAYSSYKPGFKTIYLYQTAVAWYLHQIQHTVTKNYEGTVFSAWYDTLKNIPHTIQNLTSHVYVQCLPLPAFLTNSTLSACDLKYSCWQYTMKTSQMISLINVELLPNISETVSISIIRRWYKSCVSRKYLYTEQAASMDSVGISRQSQLVNMNCNDWPTKPTHCSPPEFMPGQVTTDYLTPCD
jgi:hypothetical protein